MRRWRRRRGLGRFPRNREPLREYEARVILNDIEMMGVEKVMAVDLDRAYPGRYNMRYLPSRLKEMVTMKLLKGSAVNRSGWRIGRAYTLTELKFRETDGGGEHGRQDSSVDPG
jgi:hypothetical protein